MEDSTSFFSFSNESELRLFVSLQYCNLYLLIVPKKKGKYGSIKKQVSSVACENLQSRHCSYLKIYGVIIGLNHLCCFLKVSKIVQAEQVFQKWGKSWTFLFDVSNSTVAEKDEFVMTEVLHTELKVTNYNSNVLQHLVTFYWNLLVIKKLLLTNKQQNLCIQRVKADESLTGKNNPTYYWAKLPAFHKFLFHFCFLHFCLVMFSH